MTSFGWIKPVSLKLCNGKLNTVWKFSDFCDLRRGFTTASGQKLVFKKICKWFLFKVMWGQHLKDRLLDLLGRKLN